MEYICKRCGAQMTEAGDTVTCSQCGHTIRDIVMYIWGQATQNGKVYIE